MRWRLVEWLEASTLKCLVISAAKTMRFSASCWLVINFCSFMIDLQVSVWWKVTVTTAKSWLLTIIEIVLKTPDLPLVLLIKPAVELKQLQTIYLNCRRHIYFEWFGQKTFHENAFSRASFLLYVRLLKVILPVLSPLCLLSTPHNIWCKK